MSSDIFILTPKEGFSTKLKNEFPRAKVITGTEVTEEVLSRILKRCMTRYFYIIKPSIVLNDDFNFLFLPDKEHSELVHVWHDDLKLYPRISVKNNIQSFTDEAYRSGKIKIKHMDNKTVEETTQIISNAWPIFKTPEEGYDLCTNDYFWVIDPDVKLSNRFDLRFTPEEWDLEKIHVWQKAHPVTKKSFDYGGVRLYPKTPGPIEIKQVKRD